jgi:hypothetical protein
MSINRESLKALVDDVTVKLADAIDGAVEAETKRCVAVVGAAMRTARIRNDDRLANDLRDCLTEIGATEPPPPEPMTIDKIGDKLRKYGCIIPKVTQARYLWCDFDKDLAKLVREQARLDRNHCLDEGHRHMSDTWFEASTACAARIAEAAGLE